MHCKIDPIVVLCLAVGFDLSGCVSMLFGPPSVKSAQYDIISPPVIWTKIDPGTSDVAYQHPEDRATISLNSVCGQYQELSLDELTASLMLGLDQSRVESVEKLEVDKYPALRTTVTGSTGDAKVTVSYTVLRSAYCVYDFMLVARTASVAKHRQAYDQVMQSFHERKEP